jgi:outer membrane protein OmpA-like peptidoglycan-associated protein
MTNYVHLSLFFVALLASPVHAQDERYLSEHEKNVRIVQQYLDKAELDLNKILRGITDTEVNIYFRSNSAEINDYFSRQAIIKVAKLLHLYPMLYVRIEGFTDVRGSKAYNKQLSERRVEAVKKILLDVSRADPKRLYTHGHGEHSAQYTADDEAGMFYDRRVNIGLIVHKNSAPRR